MEVEHIQNRAGFPTGAGDFSITTEHLRGLERNRLINYPMIPQQYMYFSLRYHFDTTMSEFFGFQTFENLKDEAEILANLNARLTTVGTSDAF